MTTLGRSRMKIQEGSGDFTVGEIMFPSSETSQLNTKTKNDGKSKKLGPGGSTMCLEHGACAPSIQNVRGAGVFSYFFVRKARVFSPNLVRNSHCKYQSSSFRNSRSELEQFKWKAILKLQWSFYLLLDFLSFLFIFSNFFLVTICN